ncbi:hypothetical protein GCM10022238_10900 [Gordonia hankookensis]
MTHFTATEFRRWHLPAVGERHETTEEPELDSHLGRLAADHELILRSSQGNRKAADLTSKTFPHLREPTTSVRADDGVTTPEEP